MVKKKYKLKCFNISQKYLYIKNKNKKILHSNLGPSLVRGPRQWPNWPKPRAGPEPKEADGDLKEVPLEKVSNLYSSRMWFINNLVSIWQLVVKKFPLVTTSSAKGKSIDGSTLYKYLEVFILNCIFEITTELHDGLVQLQRVPFLG